MFSVRKRTSRDIAQFGSALRSGRRGRRFKSCEPDQKKMGNTARCCPFFVTGFEP